MKAMASDITAEIHIHIPGYGLLILPLSCATLIPTGTQDDKWDAPSNLTGLQALTVTVGDGQSSSTSMASDVGFGAVDALLKRKRRNSRQALPTDSPLRRRH